MAKSGLTPEIKALAVEVFKGIDTDGNNSIDVKETLKYWRDNFAKINTRAMFEAVDMDKNEKIDLDEWISFWIRVKKSGHSEDDIQDELTNLKNRGSWTSFVGVNPITAPKID